MEKDQIVVKLNELCQKDGFKDALEAANSKEDTVKILSEYGWNVSVKEFNDEILPVFAVSEGEELNASDLENVSGGGLIGGIVLVLGGIWLAKGFFKGMGCY